MTKVNSIFCRAAAVVLMAAPLTASFESREVQAQNAQTANAVSDAQIAALLRRLPAPDATTAAAVSRDLAALGPGAIIKLIGMLQEPDAADGPRAGETPQGGTETGDAKVEHALYGLAVHVGRSGPEAIAERRLFTETLASQLRTALPMPTKRFLLQQLNFSGGAEAASAIGGFLLDPELYDDAAQALIAMRGETGAAGGIGETGGAAVAALRAALPQARGRNLSAVIKALGVLRDAASVPAITRAMNGADRDTRQVAIFALANIGDAAATKPVMAATETASLYERGQATDAALLLARRLAEVGGAQTKDAANIYRQLQKRTGEADRPLQIAVLVGLSKMSGSGSDAGLLAGMTSPDNQISAAAITTTAAIPGKDVTARWVGRLKTVAPPARAAILTMLGRRADASALPAILAATKDTDAAARSAAIAAAGNFGSANAAKTLVALLGSQDAGDRKAAQTALAQMPGSSATTVMAAALATPGLSSPQARRALLDVLATRRATGSVTAIQAYLSDKDTGVRTAAWSAIGTLGDASIRPALLRALPKAQTDAERSEAEKALLAVSRGSGDEAARVGPIVAALKGASVPVRASLLRVLGRIGGAAALSPVQAALKDADADIVDTAVRALSEWPDSGALPTLLDVARNAPKQTHKVLALRGYVRLAGTGNMPPDERLVMFRQVMALAARPEEKKLVLSGIGGVPTLSALSMTLPFLDDAAIREEAAAAAVGIAQNSAEDQARSDATGEQTRAALRRVVAVARNEQTLRQAQELLDKPNYAARPWQVIGPFPNAGGNAGFDTAFESEQDVLKGAVDLDRGYTLPGGGNAVRWKAARSNNEGLLDFNPLFSPNTNTLAYATIAVRSPNARSAIVSVGSDDGARVWVNGQQVISKNVPRSARPGEDQVPVQLKAGWNQILLKITQGGGGWEFYFDLLDPATKKPLLDLEYAPRPQG